MNTPELPAHHIQWFEQMKLATKNGDIALMSCLDAKTKEPRSVICIASQADDGGIESAIRCNRGLKNGIYSYHGLLTNKAIADWFNLEYRDINLIVF